MNKVFLGITLIFMLSCGCSGNVSSTSAGKEDGKHVSMTEAMPVTGTFINLAYQDVRNRYTNPPYIDNTDPLMWAAKIAEMKRMGMEYLVFMAVANEFRSFYPSQMMPWAYPVWRKSPVDAIMDAAARFDMKVFLSTGWAQNQDDNLRDPGIKGQQMMIMNELAFRYKDHPAFYGWYLPVEDCLGPVLTDYAVEAANEFTARARELTPSAKILISPYGIFNSDFDDPRYEEQILKLEVDIIAYQDEVGCVRERYPLPRLRENWKKLRAIHDKTDIEMWANCESFTWEKGTNDRSSALIPAPYGRFLAQQVAAAEGGADRIISFMMCGLFDDPASPYQLGQPHWSARAFEDYMSWKDGGRYWELVEASMSGSLRNGPEWSGTNVSGKDREEAVLISDGKTAEEDAGDEGWCRYKAGKNEIFIAFEEPVELEEVMVRMLHSAKDGIVPPSRMHLSASMDGNEWVVVRIKEAHACPNTGHDAFADCILFDNLIIPKSKQGTMKPSYLKISFVAESKVCIDEVYVNPTIVE